MKNRNLIFVTVMSLVTLGIYDLYWAFSTRNELVKKGHKVPSPMIFLYPIIAALLSVLILVVLYDSPNGQDAMGVLGTVLVILMLVSALAFIPIGIYWLWRYSQAVGKVTKGKLSAEVSMVIALVTGVVGFAFIWPIVVQYYYNQLPTKS